MLATFSKLQRARLGRKSSLLQLLEQGGREAQLHGPLGLGREVQGKGLAHDSRPTGRALNTLL